MIFLIFSLLFQNFQFQETLECNNDILRAYNIEGMLNPSIKKMFLCNSVKITCCNLLDELRFHKNWYHYYMPKLEITQTKAITKFQQLSEIYKFFNNLSVSDISVPIKDSSILDELLNEVKNIDLDIGLRPLINQLPKIIAFEKESKQKFVCSLCDFENHEFFKNEMKAIYLQQGDCEMIMSYWENYLKIRTQRLNPVLVLIHKIIHQFDTNYYQKNDRSHITAVKHHTKLVKQCFPDKDSKFEFQRCQSLCNSYSISGLSPAFFGEFEFYDHIWKVFQEFKQWYEENPQNERILSFVDDVVMRKEKKNKFVILKKFQNQIDNYSSQNLRVKQFSKEKSLDRKIKNLVTNIKNYERKIDHLKHRKLQKKIFYKTNRMKRELKKYKRELSVWRKKRVVHLDSNWDLDLMTLKKHRRLQNQIDQFGNQNCQNCRDVTNAINSANITNSDFIKNSTNVADSSHIYNSSNITNSTSIRQCQNTYHSKKIENSINVNNSFDCDNVKDSTFINIGRNVTASFNCTNCYNCTKCDNCINCSNSFNVTHGFNIIEVYNSTHVSNVTNGINLLNVTDSVNITNVINSKNLTNATNCENAKNNYNCTSYQCNIPRIEDQNLKDLIRKRIEIHSKKIIDRLYIFYRVGDIESYKVNPNRFDQYIFRANNIQFDFDVMSKNFGKDGINLGYNLSDEFKEDPEPIKNAAIEVISFPQILDDGQIVVETDYNVKKEILEEVNKISTLDFLYHFSSDYKRRFLSLQTLTKIEQFNEENSEEDEKEILKYLYKSPKKENNQIQFKTHHNYKYIKNIFNIFLLSDRICVYPLGVQLSYKLLFITQTIPSAPSSNPTILNVINRPLSLSNCMFQFSKSSKRISSEKLTTIKGVIFSKIIDFLINSMSLISSTFFIFISKSYFIQSDEALPVKYDVSGVSFNSPIPQFFNTSIPYVINLSFVKSKHIYGSVSATLFMIAQGEYGFISFLMMQFQIVIISLKVQAQ